MKGASPLSTCPPRDNLHITTEFQILLPKYIGLTLSSTYWHLLDWRVHLLVAPPASGKTAMLVEKVRKATQQGQRVWWIGLPFQRAYVYRRLTEAGALLGAEFLSSQQLYYRLLAHAQRLRPLLLGTGRLVLVGQALLELRGDLPSPGEARLFSQAIAEAKRFGLTAGKLQAVDEEGKRFREVFRHYERLKADQWDYDDFRSESLYYLEHSTDELEADLIIIDGFREVGPLEYRIYQALARRTELWLSLPEAPPGTHASHSLPARPQAEAHIYRTANPVTEARWVLRALKQDLANGMNPLDLAVILPSSQSRAFVALADEYGVPMMNEIPTALSDCLPGRILLDLLELPDYPTASRLLAIPELSELANAALNRGVVGLEAINVLAGELSLSTTWQKWLGLLDSPADELRWAETLLNSSLPELHRHLQSDIPFDIDAFNQQALQRAKEASHLAKGPQFRKWWAALLQESKLYNRPAGGIALLNDTLVSGRQFRKAYLMHAVEGSYSSREAEDYFIPEDERRLQKDSFTSLGLPKRFLGRDSALFAELASRATTMIITYSEADQAGPLVPESGLIKTYPGTLPELPAASRLELTSNSMYQPSLTAVPLGRPSFEALRRYDDCAFRYWAGQLARDTKPRWQELLSDLRNYGKLNPARLEVLKGKYPEWASWLADKAADLLSLQFNVSLPDTQSEPHAKVDAAGRSASEVTLYRFCEPGRVSTQKEAEELIDQRWNELLAAGHMLSHYPGRITKVHIVVWPIGAEPIAAFEDGITYVWRRISNRQAKAQSSYQRFLSGDATPNPGFRCRSCTVADVCREGNRNV